MTEVNILTNFRKSLIDFFDSLIEIFPEEKQLIIYRIALKNAPVEEVMKHFVVNIYPHRDMIKNKENKFFTEVNLLGAVGGDENNYMKNIWCCPDLQQSDKDSVWKWMEKFVGCVKKYIDLKK